MPGMDMAAMPMTAAVFSLCPIVIVLGIIAGTLSLNALLLFVLDQIVRSPDVRWLG